MKHVGNSTNANEIGRILDLIPHRRPFRFIDEIVEIDHEHIIGKYRYRFDETFFPAHFPKNPIAPGVVLIETMAQIGVVALGLYLAADDPLIDEHNLTILFTEVQCEFSGIVRPGDEVTVRAWKEYFRLLKLKVNASMALSDGTEVCRGTIAGMGVLP